jgi:hypothetical protein
MFSSMLLDLFGREAHSTEGHCAAPGVERIGPGATENDRFRCGGIFFSPIQHYHTYTAARLVNYRHVADSVTFFGAIFQCKIKYLTVLPALLYLIRL